jgi:hypothetical protein
MSSLLFLTSCVAFKYFAGNTGATRHARDRDGGMYLLFHHLYLTLMMTENCEKAFTLTRGVWLLISFICYILARKVFMDVTDVTYEATFNKITSFSF